MCPDGARFHSHQNLATEPDATEGGREEFYQSSTLDVDLTRQTVAITDREYITDLDGNEITIGWSDWERSDVGSNIYGLADASTGEPVVKELLKVGDLTIFDSGTSQNLELTQETVDFVNGFAENDPSMRFHTLSDETLNFSMSADLLNQLIEDDDSNLAMYNRGDSANATIDLGDTVLTTDGTTITGYGRTLTRYELADATDAVDGVDVIYIDDTYTLIADVTVV